MATWNDLVGYVKTHYKIAEENPNMLKLLFETQNMRSQVVLIWHLTLRGGNEDWIQIESGIGELGKLDLSRALQMVGNTVCGGLATAGGVVTFRHSVPLENLNINEFESPLALVVNTADLFENQLTGEDVF